MTSRCITWHDTTQAFTSHQMTWPPHQMTWHASKQVTSPPWNSRRLVHSKEMVWASRWSVALRTFYRQILSLLYSSFFFWNFRPRLARELLVCVYIMPWQTCLKTRTGKPYVWDIPRGMVDQHIHDWWQRKCFLAQGLWPGRIEAAALVATASYCCYVVVFFPVESKLTYSISV